MIDIDTLLRALYPLRVGHLEHRVCTADSPMPDADKHRFMWHHPDAKENGPLANLVHCTCPHCGLSFTCFPKSH